MFLAMVYQDLLRTGEMLKLQAPNGTKTLALPMFYACFNQKVLKTGLMLKILKLEKPKPCCKHVFTKMRLELDNVKDLCPPRSLQL